MSLTLLLRSTDLQETREFYERVLGFKVSSSAETLTAEGYGGRLVFTTQDLWQSQPALSGTIYFTVPDVDGYFASVKELADLAWPLQDMSYGSREFGLRDSNGYHLAFRQQV